jgi:hypothetical protein
MTRACGLKYAPRILQLEQRLAPGETVGSILTISVLADSLQPFWLEGFASTTSNADAHIGPVNDDVVTIDFPPTSQSSSPEPSVEGCKVVAGNKPIHSRHHPLLDFEERAPPTFPATVYEGAPFQSIRTPIDTSGLQSNLVGQISRPQPQASPAEISRSKLPVTLQWSGVPLHFGQPAAQSGKVGMGRGTIRSVSSASAEPISDPGSCNPPEEFVIGQVLLASDQLWWFNGADAECYSEQINVTVLDPTSALYEWRLEGNTSAASFGNGDDFYIGGTTATIVGAGASTAHNDVAVYATPLTVSTGSPVAAFLEVKTPHRLEHIRDEDKPDSERGYATIIHY